MSANTIANLLMIGSSIIIVIAFFALGFIIEKIKTDILNNRMLKVLPPIVLDVHINEFQNVAFQIHGFYAEIHFGKGGKYSAGSTEIDISFPHNKISAVDNAGRPRPKKRQIFELFLNEKGFFGEEYRSLADIKKRLRIKADSLPLQKSLQYEDGLLSALRDIYLAADSVDTKLELNTNGIKIRCSDYIIDGSSVQRIAKGAVKACEEALKAAARAGVQLVVENPFQRAASEPVLPRCSASDASSDEALYDSLDGFSEDGGWAKASPVKHKSIVEEDMPPREDAMRELDALEPHYNELSSGPEEALTVSSENKLPQAQDERSREEDVSRLFF